MLYYFYDRTLYRLASPGDHFDRWIDGEWVPARGEVRAPSEEEYNRMREITEDEANRLRAE